MENCIYHEKIICTFDLKDDSGIYYEDMVLNWKQAASERRLTCMECGAPVYLAAGPIKEPYFAHYDTENCDYSNGKESEELKFGKRLLYLLLKRSFPDYNIQARYRLENGIYSTLFCSDGESFIAIDYHLQNSSLQKFRLRDNYYQASHITPVYILGIRQEKNTKQIDWYQSLLQNSMGYLAFLDAKQETLTLKRSFSYRLGKQRKFLYCIKTYSIRELTIDLEGRMQCDFTMEANKVEQQIKQEKLSYQKTQDNLRNLCEEKQKLEQQEQERMQAYRSAKERERYAAYVQTNELAGVQEYQNNKDQALVRTGILVNPEEQKESSHRLTELEITARGLNPTIYSKCVKMIENGEAHLVARKYYDAIMNLQ